MARSIEKARRIKEVRTVDKREYIKDLSEDQFKAVLARYYSEMEKAGFYCSLKKAISMREYFFTHPQREIAECILRSVFMREKNNIFVSLVRQFGKSEIVAGTAEFCLRRFFEVFGRPLKILIIAPEKGTSMEVFNRIKNYVIANEPELAVDRSNEIETIAGDKIVLYGLYGGGSGTIEGRTFDMIIRDEGHLGNDDIFIDQVLPTTNRTRGPIICIGNGGFSDCYFYRGLKRGTDPAKKNYSFIYNYDSLRDYMLSLAKEGLESAYDWVSATDNYIEMAGGTDSLFVRKNVLCEWILELGAFLSVGDIESCSTTVIDEIGKKFFLGYDVAYKGQDRSVVCIMDEYRNILDYWVIKDIGEMVPLEEQAIRLREICDTFGITNAVDTIGVDATGMGVGAAEAIERAFPSTNIVRFEFSTAKKMNWYIHFRDSVITSNVGHKPRFNRNLLGYGKKIKCMMDQRTLNTAISEMTDMEIKIYDSGLLGFHAPTSGKLIGKSVNDDFVTSSVLAFNSLGAALGSFFPLLGQQFSPSRRPGEAGLALRPGEDYRSGIPPKLQALRRLTKSGRACPW